MTRTLRTALLTLACAGLLAAGPSLSRVGAQVVVPRAGDLRFELSLNEPVAAADLGGVVAGTSVMLLRDRRTGECHVVLRVGSEVAMAPTGCGG